MQIVFRAAGKNPYLNFRHALDAIILFAKAVRLTEDKVAPMGMYVKPATHL